MLTLSPTVHDALLIHLRRVLPWEGCGFLGGHNGRATVALPVANVATRRDRFRMAPDAQVRALLALQSQGVALLAIYHSHPQGAALPSAVDIAAHAYPEAALVIVAGPERRHPTMGAWRLQGNAATSIMLRIGSRA